MIKKETLFLTPSKYPTIIKFHQKKNWLSFSSFPNSQKLNTKASKKFFFCLQSIVRGQGYYGDKKVLISKFCEIVKGYSGKWSFICFQLKRFHRTKKICFLIVFFKDWVRAKLNSIFFGINCNFILSLSTFKFIFL